jgi:hypothetical protein
MFNYKIGSKVDIYQRQIYFVLLDMVRAFYYIDDAICQT